MPKFKDPTSGEVTRAPYTKAGYKKIKGPEEKAEKAEKAKTKKNAKPKKKRTTTRTRRA